MKFRSLAGIAARVALPALVSSAAPLTARADQFIGFAQPSFPDSWAIQMYPTYQHTSPNANSASSSASLAYFTRTGVTGTERDRFEFLLGGAAGYSTTQGAPDSSAFGFAAPSLGIEYYYNVLVPDRPPGTPGYVTFWTNPAFGVAFPNGSHKTTGFGAGADQYSFALALNNYLGIGRWAITFSPVQLAYSARNLNETDLGFGLKTKLKTGLSATFMEVAAGYAVRDDLVVGIHHAYSIYGWKGADFIASKEGKIGPSFTWLGWAKHGIYVFGNIDRDYYTSSNLRKSTSVTMSIVKVLR